VEAQVGAGVGEVCSCDEIATATRRIKGMLAVVQQYVSLPCPVATQRFLCALTWRAVDAQVCGGVTVLPGGAYNAVVFAVVERGGSPVVREVLPSGAGDALRVQ